jgi:predicted ester cyclase
MSIEENKAIAARLLDAHNRGDAAQLREVLAPDFAWYIADMPERLNREHYIQGVEMGRRTFSDLSLVSEDIVAEGEKVVLRILVRGRHTGAFQEIAPTGREVQYSSVAILRIAGGKVVEEWLTNDQLHLLSQLGAFPPQP